MDAIIMAFSAYPERCVADRRVDLATSGATINIYLPDACKSMTVILSHTDPIAGTSARVQVGIQPALVSDTFGRGGSTGWGMMDGGMVWRSVPGTLPAPSVSNGRGVLPLGSGHLNRVRASVWSQVEHLLASASLSDCSHADDVVWFNPGAAFGITAGSVVRSPSGTDVVLPDFDPCEPWFVKADRVDYDLEVRVWQATEPEPAEPVLTLDTADRIRLEITGMASSATPARQLLVDWLDLQLVPST